MKAKYISVVLALVLCLSMLCIPVSAKTGQNLLPEGSFDSAEDLERFRTMHGVVAQWDEEGATKTPGSARLVGAASGKYLVWYVMTLQGETYDISFYAKCTGQASSFTIYAPFFDTDGGYCTIATNQPISTSWTKYNFTWTVPETDNKGTKVDGPVQISVRLNNANSVAETMWLDEICITPHGKIDVDYNSKEAYRGDWVDTLKAEKPVANAEFSDTKGHWAEYTLKALAANGYVNGMGDGKFAPEAQVTRAQFITMMMNTINVADIKYQDIYKDVSEDSYYAKSVQLAYQLGIINPAMTTGKMLRPDKEITREEAASMLVATVKAKGGAVSKSNRAFVDEDDISLWAVEDVSKAAASNLILGDEKGSFNPKKTLTRAEAATMLMRVIETQSRLAVFVDPEAGDDKWLGTADAPVKTVEAARKLVNPSTDKMQHHTFVYLKAGEHYLEDALTFDETDSGENGYNIIYTSYGDGKARLMSGKHFSDWSLYDKDKNIYRTRVDDIDSRQVYINGVRGIRARSEGVQGLSNVTIEDFGHTTTDTFLADYKYPGELELVYIDEWTQPRAIVKDIEEKDGKAHIILDDLWMEIARNNGGKSATTPHWYENAYELLDNPGEWYINAHDGYLYYMPRPFENPETMVATVPVGERIVNLYGASAENVIHNIVFDNVEFAYTTWMLPSYYGISEAQSMVVQTGVDALPATASMPGAAVRVSNGRYIDFTNCTFSKLGCSGLQMFDAIQDCDVIGNHFYDISASALYLGETGSVDGEPFTYRENINPLEYKYFVVNNKINNNYIHDVALEDGSSAGLAVAFPKDTQIHHNEIGNLVYSGMHIGWGWASYAAMGTATDNLSVNYNYVYETMNDEVRDGGAIYTIGAAGGKEVANTMTGNYLQKQHNLASYFYTDEGTTNWDIYENVVDGKGAWTWPGRDGGDARVIWMKLYRTTIQNNIARNNYTNIPEHSFVEGNEFYGNTVVAEDEPWPEAAQSIIDNAGLEPEYAAKYSDGVRYIRGQREMRIAIGETEKMSFTAYGRKDKTYPAESLKNIYYVSSDSDVATVDEHGNIKALGTGIADVTAYLLIDDYVVKTRTTVVCGEVMEEVTVGLDYLNLVEDCDVIMKPQALTNLGRTTVPDVSYEIADETVAKIDAETNTITGVKAGNTTLKVTFADETGEIAKEYPVKVAPLASDEALTIDAVSPDASFFSAGNWSVGASTDGKGIKINTPGSESINKAVAYEGLINFDLAIDETSSGWPSFAFSVDGNGYASGDIYMIGFKNDIIELQRFNKGERTVIFGAVDGFVSVGGQGIPNNDIFEYKKTYNVTMGTIEEENGTRIILNIDGVNIFDYLDESPKRLKGPYYPLVYARTSNFFLQPAGK